MGKQYRKVNRNRALAQQRHGGKDTKREIDAKSNKVKLRRVS